MPSSLEAAAIALVLVAPGLLFELGIENRHAFWRTKLGDRILRFFAWSLLFHAIVWPLSIWLALQLSKTDWQSFGLHVWATWVLIVAYALGPLAVGLLLPEPILERLVGRSLPPTAWDKQWSKGRQGYVRARFRDSGRWVAGVWDFASSFPSPKDDLLIDPVLSCDPKNGALLLDDSGLPISTDWSTLLSRDDLDRIEFQPFP